MEFAIPGFVKKFCTPNALLTLTEYLTDYASPEVRAKGLARIEAELAEIPDSNPIKRELMQKLERIRQGERDLFF